MVIQYLNFNLKVIKFLEMMGSARRSSELKWSIRQREVSRKLLWLAWIRDEEGSPTTTAPRPINLDRRDENVVNEKGYREECIACAVYATQSSPWRQEACVCSKHIHFFFLLLSSGLFPSLYSSRVVYILNIYNAGFLYIPASACSSIEICCILSHP